MAICREDTPLDYQSLWNAKHRQFYHGTVAHDGFLDPYAEVIAQTKLPVIDLGCGTGNNALWLSEHNKQVIACDYAKEALEILHAHVPEAVTCQCDLSAPLPFADASADTIISDMSLHFFDEAATRRLIAEIARILRPRGCLVLRCNHIDDYKPAANVLELEPNFYHIDGLDMRYFDRDSLLDFFAGWRVHSLEADLLTRYTPARHVWRALLGRP